MSYYAKWLLSCWLLMAVSNATGQTLVDLKDQKLDWGEKTAGTQVALVADAAKGPVAAHATVAVSIYVNNSSDSIFHILINEPFHGILFFTSGDDGKIIQISPANKATFHMSFATIPPESTYLFNVELPPEIIKLIKNGLIACVVGNHDTDNKGMRIYSNKITLPAK